MSGRCSASVAKEQAVSPFTKSNGVSGYGGGNKPVGVKKWIEKQSIRRIRRMVTINQMQKTKMKVLR